MKTRKVNSKESTDRFKFIILNTVITIIPTIVFFDALVSKIKRIKNTPIGDIKAIALQEFQIKVYIVADERKVRNEVL